MAGFVRPDFLPTPVRGRARRRSSGVDDGSLLSTPAVSVAEIMTGFVLASIVAVPLGILMGSFKIVEAAIEPVTNFVRYLPVSALIPLLILWVGIGIEEKIAVIFIGTLFQQIILIADVSRAVPSDLLDVSYTLGANRRTVVDARADPGDAAGRDRHAARHARLGLDLSGGRRARRRQQGARLLHPQLDARPVHRPDLPRHHGDRACSASSPTSSSSSFAHWLLPWAFAES